MSTLQENPKPVKPAKAPKEPKRSDETLMVASGGSAKNLNIRNIPLLIQREFMARVTKKGYWFATASLVFVVLLISILPIIIEFFTSSSQTKVVVINQAGQVAGADPVTYFDTRLNIPLTQLVQQGTANNSATPATNNKPPTKKEFDVKAGNPADEATLRQQVKDGKIKGLVQINRNAAGDLSFDYYSDDSSLGTTAITVQSAASELNLTDKIARSGISLNQFASLSTPPEFKNSKVTVDNRGAKSTAETVASYILALASVVLIFTSLITYGQAIAVGAVEEKSNRVMEIMVNAATPFQMLMGKVIGVGAAGLIQISITVLTGLVAFAIQPFLRNVLLGDKSGGIQFDLAAISVPLLLAVLVYWILGFLMYAGLYGALGSLVSRPEEVQNAISPLTILFTGGYLVAIFALQAVDNIWVTILSFIPFFTPILMPIRVALTDVQWWEVPLSIVLLTGGILLMTFIASRIYRAGVLAYGQKAGFGKILKLVFRG